MNRLPTLTTVHPYKGTVVLLFESDYKVKASLAHTNSLATFLVSSILSGLLGGKTARQLVLKFLSLSQ